ncbi:BTB domain-containing protein [Mycena sanguinolenta]|uniref:BTB domain-containing protein n=1 Tax=Mycena sanguinolenta TaxID=230812 RepID=A0A8H7D9A8_9AGAR|nr:BTB domain-containing protein [Mycena sanguinolenta]
MHEGRNPQQIEGLWFSNDSLVVLSAGDKIFRVPKSILAARSSVFQAMFEFPQPTTDADEMSKTIEGSPVIHLHDDPGEVEAFLRAIFDSSYFMPPPNEVDFLAVLGILRLSHKYDVAYLYKRAISYLETLYPIELHEVGGDTTILYPDWDAELRALEVIHEVGATWLLPFAYHSIVEYSGIKYRTWGHCPTARKELILRICMLQREATERLFDSLTLTSTCAFRDACNLSKFAFLKTRGNPNERHDQSPLREDTFSNRPALDRALCLSCSAEAGREYDAVRSQIWLELPANCDLEGWDVLLKQRAVALV